MKIKSQDATQGAAESPTPFSANSLQDITDKKGLAIEWDFSVRTIDNLIARGMPHLKIGKRRCRFSRAEVRDWMRAQFRTVRRG